MSHFYRQVWLSGGNEDAGKAFVKTLLGKEAGASSNGMPGE